jgi:predicted RNA-binding Zn ribbon-like protein
MGAGRPQLVKFVLMETAEGFRELPVVGGHLALDFANTVDDPLGPQRHDHIADYPSLLAWSARVVGVPEEGVDLLAGIAGQHPRRAADVVRRAAALRAAMNDTFAAVIDGADTAGPWLSLRPYLADAVDNAVTPVPLTWEYSSLGAPLWPVAEAAYRLLVGPDLARLKRCGGCPWLFLDQSKNGSRRWCAMQDCGTHQKVRRYVAKRAAARTGGVGK